MDLGIKFSMQELGGGARFKSGHVTIRKQARGLMQSSGVRPASFNVFAPLGSPLMAEGRLKSDRKLERAQASCLLGNLIYVPQLKKNNSWLDN